MYKTYIFDKILQLVIEETGISAEQILSPCKQSEIVDARHILVKLLSDEGLYSSHISEMVGITQRSVNIILTNFSTRKSFSKVVFTNYESVKNKLGNDNLSG